MWEQLCNTHGIKVYRIKYNENIINKLTQIFYGTEEKLSSTFFLTRGEDSAI